MLQKMMVLLLLCSLTMGARAAVAGKAAVSETGNTPERQLVSAAALEDLTGKKMGWFQKMQWNRMQRQAATKKPGVFPEREELTEGFQWLPFFGSLLTCGLVYFIMLFSAKDANALRWAAWGALIVFVASLSLKIANLASGQ